MIDKLFGALEDIYFTVITEPSNEDDNQSTVLVFSNATLLPLIEEFKTKAHNQVYVGKSGNQFKLLKLATFILNYMMHEDDGVFSEDEKMVIKEYIHSKLSRLISSQKEELNMIFNIQVSLENIISYINEHELPLRSIDMILDKLIDQVDNQPRYFKPLESIYTSLLEL